MDHTCTAQSMYAWLSSAPWVYSAPYHSCSAWPCSCRSNPGSYQHLHKWTAFPKPALSPFSNSSTKQWQIHGGRSCSGCDGWCSSLAHPGCWTYPSMETLSGSCCSQSPRSLVRPGIEINVRSVTCSHKQHYQC